MLFFKKVVKRIDTIAGIIFFTNCLLVMLSILTRLLFKTPIFGVYEIVSYGLLIMSSLALANCALVGGHINITFLVEKLSVRRRKVVEIILGIIILINFILITWNILLYMIDTSLVGTVSDGLRIPMEYLIAIVMFGFLLLTLAVLIKLIDDIKNMKQPLQAREFYEKGVE